MIPQSRKCEICSSLDITNKCVLIFLHYLCENVKSVQASTFQINAFSYFYIIYVISMLGLCGNDSTERKCKICASLNIIEVLVFGIKYVMLNIFPQ